MSVRKVLEGALGTGKSRWGSDDKMGTVRTGTDEIRSLTNGTSAAKYGFRSEGLFSVMDSKKVRSQATAYAAEHDQDMEVSIRLGGKPVAAGEVVNIQGQVYTVGVDGTLRFQDKETLAQNSRDARERLNYLLQFRDYWADCDINGKMLFGLNAADYAKLTKAYPQGDRDLDLTAISKRIWPQMYNPLTKAYENVYVPNEYLKHACTSLYARTSTGNAETNINARMMFTLEHANLPVLNTGLLSSKTIDARDMIADTHPERFDKPNGDKAELEKMTAVDKIKTVGDS